MATYVLIHGAGDVGWYWHLVVAQLEARGHSVIAPDMPVDDDTADLNDKAAAVIAAIDTATNVIVVGTSFGGYVAPIVASRVQTELLVLVAGMVPAPGETAHEMFENTSYEPEPLEDDSPEHLFLHDVDPNLGREALARGREQAKRAMTDPWPLTGWPNVPTRFILGNDDRLFPAAWLRQVVQDRLGIVPDELPSGHCIGLSMPVQLADLLMVYLGRPDA